jgi:hypothetical protein
MNKTEDFLAKLEGLLEREVGGNWSYEFETEADTGAYGDWPKQSTLRFKTFNVWGEQFNQEENE